jgi:fatty acid amide hydrolase
VFTKSNMPQLFYLESENFIYGRAENPWSPERTPGGSSGGEGGLISSRSSPLGIGTDVGGSIRVPSHFCGIYGMKPSPGRITGQGMVLPSPNSGEWNRAIIQVVAGPIGRCVEDLALFYEAVCVPAHWYADPYVYPLVFNKGVYNQTYTSRSLTIGYYIDDGLCPVTDVIRSVVTEVKDALAARGHRLVEIHVPNMRKVTASYARLLAADGGIRAI